jgi:hypothetical protein
VKINGDFLLFQVKKHKDDLLSYIIFLRITPFLPNWFINVASPVIDVPLLPFFVGTFVGKHGFFNIPVQQRKYTLSLKLHALS